MKLHFMGKYDQNSDSLPHNEHFPGAVKYKEPDDLKKFAILANVIAFVISAVLAVFAVIRCLDYFELKDFTSISLGCFVSVLTLFPHELLHAVCFKKDVYFYTDFAKGIAFVTGTEPMSKGRFILMSLLPNIVFGFIPYIIGLIFPNQMFLISLGVMATGMGAGDYFNIFNTLTQVPKGAKVYMHKTNTYWYIPQDENDL